MIENRSGTRKRSLPVEVQWRVGQHMSKLEQARQILALKPDDRLRWVLAFAKEDLSALTATHRIEYGYQLRWLTPADERTQWGYPASAGPMRDSTLWKLQADIRRGINKLLAVPRQTWTLPAPRMASLTSTERVGDKLKTFQFHWTGREADTILLGVASLIRNHGARLRACRTCQDPFLANKRQEYCTPICGQRMRDEKKAQRQKGRGRP